MAKRFRKSINNLIHSAEVSINNALAEQDILEKLSSYGYKPEKISEGKEILNNFKKLIERYASLQGEQKVITSQLSKIFKEAVKSYQNLVKVAKAILNKEQLSQLGVVGAMPRTLPKFLEKANIAFNNAINIVEINNELAIYGFTKDKIQSEYQKIQDLANTNERQEAAKGEAQQLTKTKDAELKKLIGWYSKFIKIARVALSDNKQLLEKLGIRVYSNKTTAQRKAPQKAKETRNKKKSGA